MKKPLLLDLFSGAGGAARGYADAGFEVIGVDIVPQKHYPYHFIQADAMDVLNMLLSEQGLMHEGYALDDFAAIHASPVCKGYSMANNIQHRSYPMLIEPVRSRLRETGVPWILENVVMTGKWRGHMPGAMVLCGTMFDLKVYRHRFFESSHLLFAPCACSHPHELLDGYVCIYGHRVRGRQKGHTGNKYADYSIVYGREAMGIDWKMTQTELSQSIPPAYTRWIGSQLLEIIHNINDILPTNTVESVGSAA